MSPSSFDPVRALTTLVDHGVRFVIIGGFAGRLWGSTTVTNDLDICYARDSKNLFALGNALRDLRAVLRGVPPDLPFQLDARSLALGDSFTFATTAGNLDCLATPAGSGGFQDLISGAAEVAIGALRVPVASLEDLMRLKQAAGRPKDRIELEILSALKEEIEKG